MCPHLMSNYFDHLLILLIVTTQFNKSLAVAEMGDHFVTIHMDQKLGAVPLVGGGSSVPN